MFETIKNYCRKIPKLFLLVTLLISAYSVVMIFSAQRAYSSNYAKTQLMAIVLGYMAAFVITLIDYRSIANFWYIIAGFCIFLMLYTLAFAEAVESSGGVSAKAWITVAGYSFQPSELVKIGFMVTFAKHISVVKENGKLSSFLHVFLLAVHALIPMILCHFQGDDGAAMIFLCMFLVMAFGAGVQARYFLILFGLILVVLPLAWHFDILAPYQKMRFTAMFHLDDPNFDSDVIFQQVQGRTSIGSGQLWGRGLFQGPRVTNGSVPFQHSDYIFATIGEELGFLGGVAVLLLLGGLLALTLRCASRAADCTGSVICLGFFGLVFSQAFINLGMCLGLLPVMGVTLPFFSAGGSSAMCLYLGVGLVINVYMRSFFTKKTMLRKDYPLSGVVG